MTVSKKKDLKRTIVNGLTDSLYRGGTFKVRISHMVKGLTRGKMVSRRKNLLTD